MTTIEVLQNQIAQELGKDDAMFSFVCTDNQGGGRRSFITKAGNDGTIVQYIAGTIISGLHSKSDSNRQDAADTMLLLQNIMLTLLLSDPRIETIFMQHLHRAKMRKAMAHPDPNTPQA